MHQNLYPLVAAYFYAPVFYTKNQKASNPLIFFQAVTNRRSEKISWQATFLDVPQIYPISFGLNLFLGILTFPSCGRLETISRRAETLRRVVLLWPSSSSFSLRAVFVVEPKAGNSSVDYSLIIGVKNSWVGFYRFEVSKKHVG